MFKLTCNCSIQKSCTEDTLFRKDLYNPIEGISVKLNEMDDKAWERIYAHEDCWIDLTMDR